MQFSRLKNSLIVLLVITILTTVAVFVSPANEKVLSQTSAVASNQNVLVEKQAPLPPPPPQKLSNPPEIIKAVYVTGYSASAKSYLEYLSGLFESTEINAVVLDIKGSDGRMEIYDADKLVRFLHDKNIYVIGRIAVFEDPTYSKIRPELAIYSKAKTTDLANPVLWKDNNGLAWMDPASKDVWDYNVSLAKNAFAHGFDEINFDYVRFPSDGKISNMGFPVWDGTTLKKDVIKSFFEYLRVQLPKEKISADLFGQTTTNTDDMGIGQILETALENFDYVSPMVYPSHYIKGFIGFSNPAEHPYEIIKYSMDTALARKKNMIGALVPLAKIRPWLQDFNMGADYTAEMVKSEIKATEDSLGNDYNGFMLWNPSNIYTKGSILKPNTY